MKGVQQFHRLIQFQSPQIRRTSSQVFNYMKFDWVGLHQYHHDLCICYSQSFILQSFSSVVFLCTILSYTHCREYCRLHHCMNIFHSLYISCIDSTFVNSVRHPY